MKNYVLKFTVLSFLTIGIIACKNDDDDKTF